VTPLIGIARFCGGKSLARSQRGDRILRASHAEISGALAKSQHAVPLDDQSHRGCEFGCKYCYARYTHEFMELHDSEAFERKIFVKHFDGAAFQSELPAPPSRAKRSPLVRPPPLSARRSENFCDPVILELHRAKAAGIASG